MDLDDVEEELRLDEGEHHVDKEHAMKEAHGQRGVALSQVAVEPETIEETTTFKNTQEAVAHADVKGQSQIIRSRRMSRREADQVTLKSDKEALVDVPTSPLPPKQTKRAVRPGPPLPGTRRSSRNKGNTQSFSVSDSFEDEMRDIGTGRIEIEIRSSPKKKDVPSYENILPESPEHAEEQKQAVEGTVVNACSMSEGGESKKPRRGRSAKKTRQAMTGNGSQKPQDSQDSQDRRSTPTSQLTAQNSLENMSLGSGTWLRKRKRSYSVQGGGKKQRHQKGLGEPSPEEIPDSQPAAAVDQGNSDTALEVGILEGANANQFVRSS